MKLSRISSLLAASAVLSFSAQAHEFGLSLEGRYDMGSVKADTTMKTKAFKMTGMEGVLLFQMMPGSSKAIAPYIGIGVGMIPTYTGAKADVTDPSVTPFGMQTKITLKGVNYATVEVGPEFMFTRVRWQIFVGYDYGFGGKLSRTVEPSGGMTFKDTKLQQFNRARVGTRVYFVLGSHFDIGLVGDYTFTGSFKDDGKNGGTTDTVTSYKFTEMSAGIALRVRFP